MKLIATNSFPGFCTSNAFAQKINCSICEIIFIFFEVSEARGALKKQTATQ